MGIYLHIQKHGPSLLSFIKSDEESWSNEDDDDDAFNKTVKIEGSNSDEGLTPNRPSAAGRRAKRTRNSAKSAPPKSHLAKVGLCAIGVR